ncbi:hypothetical protein PMAYCL1PPCAC_29907, partial [Pristionchus mayeri]
HSDDSDFDPRSQDSADAEETMRIREEPVRTRRSARVNLPSNDSQLMDEEGEVNEEMEEAVDELDVTLPDEEGEVAAAAADPPERRLTRSSAASCQNNSQDNLIFTEQSAPPTPNSQSSSMEVETGFIPNTEDQSKEGNKRGKGNRRRTEEESLDATLPPQEDQGRVNRRRRGQKGPMERDEVLCDTPPPMEERRVTRRSMKENSQSSQTSQENEGRRKKNNTSEEERKKREEDARRVEVERSERRKNEKIEKEKEKERKEEEERRRKEEERKKDEKTKEQPIAGLTKIVLRALEDKCIRHEKGLVPSQELVNAAVITLEEEDPEVVPHYVYLVCKIMRRVLSTRTTDGRVYDETFWSEDLRMISKFLSLKDDAKLLFIRLFTRKRTWHLPERLREKYDYLKGRVDGAIAELLKEGFLESGKTGLTSTEETLRLCSLEKLKLIAKDFRVEANKPKASLISSLMSTASTQKTLFVASTPGNTGRLLTVAKKQLGPVYRTSLAADSFFRALFSLYSPALTDSHLVAEDRTINIISNMMFRMKEIHYESIPRRAPFPCEEIIGVYEDKEDLYEFVGAKEAEERQLRAIDRHDMKIALEEAERARKKLAEMKSTRMNYLLSLPAHHRPYTREAVLTRIASRGVDCLERKKDYAAACNWIKFIVRHQVVSSLLPHSMGALYERLALDLHHHCAESDEAIDEIKRALEDPLVPDKHRLNLDDRAKRILKDGWESKFSLTPPAEIVIEGETIGRDLGNERKNLFVKTTKDGDVEQISVERVALDYFLEEGMENGLHSEGEIWHLAFKLLFWDVIYTHGVQGVWLCELQASPLDHDHSLYEARKDAFEERFEWLRSSSEEDRLAMVEQNWNGTETITMAEFKGFLSACSLPTLLGVLTILAKEPRHRRSGFPDLVLWSATKQMITVAEVKGPGDTLSTKQRLWLDFFMNQDNERVKAYLCKVKASGRKRIQ